MTLAELFLLALLVGWLGSRDEITNLEVGRSELEAALATAKDGLRKTQADLDELNKKYAELMRSAGQRDPRTGELIKFGEKPKCDIVENVLVSASVRRGVTTARTLRAFGKFSAATTYSDQELDKFLRDVRRDSDAVSIIPNQPGCRWQYQLEWETDLDYRVGREKFEYAFYVKQIIQVFSKQ